MYFPERRNNGRGAGVHEGWNKAKGLIALGRFCQTGVAAEDGGVEALFGDGHVEKVSDRQVTVVVEFEGLCERVVGLFCGVRVVVDEVYFGFQCVYEGSFSKLVARVSLRGETLGHGLDRFFADVCWGSPKTLLLNSVDRVFSSWPSSHLAKAA